MEDRNLVIVEGADCMGKTTLVEQLHKILGWPVLHTGGPKTDEQLEATCQKLETLRGSWIIDRTPHLSEIAYRPITRDGEGVSLEDQQAYVNRLAVLNPVVILCRKAVLPDVIAVERPHKPLDYWAKVQAGYGGIVARYDNLAKNLFLRNVDAYIYDWSSPGAFGVLETWLNWQLFGRKGL